MIDYIETFNNLFEANYGVSPIGQRVAVIGSRNFSDYNLFSAKITHLTKNIPDICFVSGGCKTGADNLIERYCNANNLPILIFYLNYAELGKSAPLKRNQEIVDNSDMLIAFWDGESRGTKHTIDLAEKKGIPNRIIKI